MSLSPETGPLASVVIPARNAAAVIGEQLASIATQPEAAQLEVIVVDNASSDGTAAVARTWADQLPGLRVLDAQERPSQGYARNVGIAAATGDVILLCDADDRVGPGWAGQLIAGLASADSVAGFVTSWDGSREAVAGPASLADAESFAVRFGFLPAFGGNNAAFTKHVWSKLGGFDESIHPAEDIDLSWRIQLAGYSLAFAPTALVFGRERPGPAARFRQTYRYGIAQVALFAQHGPAGMPRTSTWDALRKLSALVRHLPDLARGPEGRRTWCTRAGWRCGRVAGSIRHRTVNL